jgi:hypothetical protein
LQKQQSMLNSELEQFLGGLKDDTNITDPFGENQNQSGDVPNNTDDQPAKANTGEDDDNFSPKNRRERRLSSRLEAEREANIRLAARLEAIAEIKKDTEQDGADQLSAIERIYGTDSPEAREATNILKQALLGIKEQAKREALAEIEKIREQESTAVKSAESTLDSMIEEIEDEFDVDLTSPQSEQDRINFFKLLQRMSPKDRDGEIIGYADHYAVWEAYQARKQQPRDNTAKNLASRGMSEGTPIKSETSDKAIESFLRANNII